MYSHLNKSTISALYSGIIHEQRFYQDFYVMQKKHKRDICTNDIERYRNLGYKVRYRIHKGGISVYSLTGRMYNNNYGKEEY